MLTTKLERTFEENSSDGTFHWVVIADETMMGTSRTARADWLQERHLRRMTPEDRRRVEAMAQKNRLEACRHELSKQSREELERSLERGPDAEELQRWGLDREQWSALARQLLQ